jgi:hypothetical protein
MTCCEFHQACCDQGRVCPAKQPDYDADAALLQAALLIRDHSAGVSEPPFHPAELVVFAIFSVVCVLLAAGVL